MPSVLTRMRSRIWRLVNSPTAITTSFSPTITPDGRAADVSVDPAPWLPVGVLSSDIRTPFDQLCW